VESTDANSAKDQATTKLEKLRIAFTDSPASNNHPGAPTDLSTLDKLKPAVSLVVNLNPKSAAVEASYFLNIGPAVIDLKAQVMASKPSTQLILTGDQTNKTQVVTLQNVIDSIGVSDTPVFNTITSILPSSIFSSGGFSHMELDFLFEKSTQFSFGFKGRAALGGLFSNPNRPLQFQIVAGKYQSKSFFSVGLVTSIAILGDVIEEATSNPSTPGVDLLESFQASELGVVLSTGQPTITTKEPSGFYTFTLGSGPLSSQGPDMVEGLNLVAFITTPDCGACTSDLCEFICVILTPTIAENGPFVLNVGVSKKTGLSLSAKSNKEDGEGGEGNSGFNMGSLTGNSEKAAKGSKTIDFKVDQFAVSPSGTLKC
jgi:hypothetical protein